MITALLIAAACLFIVVFTWAVRRLFPRKVAAAKPMPELDEWGLHTRLDYALIASLEAECFDALLGVTKLDDGSFVQGKSGGTAKKLPSAPKAKSPVALAPHVCDHSDYDRIEDTALCDTTRRYVCGGCGREVDPESDAPPRTDTRLAVKMQDFDD